ncbi:unnamed protein product [Trichobilharzia regenti]|nr:unnamed protein product [Trichobilharzia regenti]
MFQDTILSWSESKRLMRLIRKIPGLTSSLLFLCDEIHHNLIGG